MRFEDMPFAKARPDDIPQMVEAIEALKSAGYAVRRPENNSYQLKVTERLSYYPSKGTMLEDGASALMKQRGLSALLHHLSS